MNAAATCITLVVSLPGVREDSPFVTSLPGGSIWSACVENSHAAAYQKDHEERDRRADKLQLDGVRVSLAVLERRSVVHMIEGTL